MSGKVITRRGGNGLRSEDGSGPGRRLREAESKSESAQLHRGERHQPAPSYYDVSMLKSPVWKWEIADYFFLGGLSTGAYLIARAAGRFGGKKFESIARVGAYTAFATILPCPPLLIHDLGDPKRFHHMLRVWKPSSPMNLGTWAIMGYSGMVTYEVIRQCLTDHPNVIPKKHRDLLIKVMNNPALLAAHDAAGIPFSLLVAGYTGVLLSCTSNPLWCKNPWLGPLFSSSAIATGAEAISLVMSLLGDESELSQQTLMLLDTVAHAMELTCAHQFQKAAGDKAKPLKTGKMAKHHQFSTLSIVAAEVIKLVPTPSSLRRLKRIIVASLGITGGFLLRWSIVHGGIEAASDPDLARLGTAPKKSATPH